MDKAQALVATEFHEPRLGKPCMVWRVNGVPKLWKRDSSRFRIPVKWGLYRYGYITEANLDLVHLPQDCPHAH